MGSSVLSCAGYIERAFQMLDEFSLHFRLHVLLAGIEDGQNFLVAREDGDRLQDILMRTDDSKQFFCFTCTDGTAVALNIDCIDLVNFLWESGTYHIVGEEPDPGIQIHFRGRVEPDNSVPADDTEMDMLFADLDEMQRGDRLFLSFRDEDGEIITLRADHATMITVRTD